MAFIFDHLVAFLVGATLLVGLLFFQQRGQQTAIQSTVRYRAETQAASFVEVLSRDLENARTRQQAKVALGLYEADDVTSGGGPRERALGVHTSGGELEWFQFVTLADPSLGEASPLIAVAYRMEPTGEQTTASGQVRDLHRVVRYVYDGTGGWAEAGGSPATVVGLDLVVPGGATGRLTELPARLDVQVEMAFASPDRLAADQAQRAEVGLTQQGATARVYAAGTGGRALPAPQGSAEIPRVPWVGPYIPPPPPPPPPPGGGGSSGGGSSGGGGAGGGPGGGGTSVDSSLVGLGGTL
jgi:hypothetical protein